MFRLEEECSFGCLFLKLGIITISFVFLSFLNRQLFAVPLLQDKPHFNIVMICVCLLHIYLIKTCALTYWHLTCDILFPHQFTFLAITKGDFNSKMVVANYSGIHFDTLKDAMEKKSIDVELRIEFYEEYRSNFEF